MILAVAPTEREARAIGADVRICGAGSAAAVTTVALLERERPQAVVLFGVSGALDPSLRPGDLVIARSVLGGAASDGRLLEAAARVLRTRGTRFVTSRLLTVQEPVTSRSAKARLWNESGAAAIDMETAIVAEAASRATVPSLAVRAVLDPATASLPASLASWSPANEAELVKRMAISPSNWAALIRLALANRRALVALRAAAAAVLPALEAALATPAPEPAQPLAVR